ncbi:4-hydroxybenzoyl-CoA thioesterase [Hydrogenovibrio sp. SC-1]|uniref:acyl-CoA thioesterase n=1 Tax=Hydrogenovibrio sp. SC-1 TaxID=2065820 RepID=UPI000C7961D9|nr:acyl-CoA thioesterase [Hydrogenovibrio sp. SC-1]PLA74247.1 4-hydroxybenzoyl-CoA thioesterase [Hydrogenovibrio sp. SC-1]
MFELEMRVRDYECDMQGVVNNAVYQNYLEHARHEFLLANGIHFAEVTARGIHLMVARAELDYKAALKANDAFLVRVKLVAEGRSKVAFFQDIIREDDTHVLGAKIIGVTVKNGRPVRLLEELVRLASS